MEIINLNKKHIANLIKEGERMDGRKLFEYRDLKIEGDVSVNAEGSARVKLGKTDVIVGVKLDVQEPYTDHPDQGTLITSMEFSPICGERYEAGPPKINAIEVARVVDRGIRESGFIDFKKLCIKKGEKVWSVLIDIYCINDDGNVLDAAAIGTVVALKLARFPVYDKKEERVKFGEFTKEELPLTENVPFTMTFHKIGDKFFIDPNRDEEDTSEARLTLTISCPKKDKVINAMQKGNIDLISVDELDKIIVESEKIYDKMLPKIEKEIEELKKQNL